MKINELIQDLKTKIELNSFEKLFETNIHFNREILLNEVNSDVANAIETLIRFWNRADEENNIPREEREPIKFFIDSPGGELVAAFTLINAIELSKTPVWTINIGAAYSAGFFIFIAGHKRVSYPLASFLFHEGSTGGGFYDAHKFRNQADFYNKQLQQLKEHTLKYTNISEKEYQTIMKDDYWLTAEEAIEKGVADEIAKEFIL